MNQVTQERISGAEKINERITELLCGRYDDHRRITLTLAYLSLSLDHHRAIILLIRSRLYGSALALVRPVFEAMIRAHWVVKCASEAEVDEVAEDDNFRFPKMNDMAKAVDQAFSDPIDQPLAFFRQAKKDAWKATNSYTHSGLLQLTRQFSGDRVESRYPDEDLLDALNASTASILMLGYLLAHWTTKWEEAGEIEKLFCAFGD